MRPSPLLLVVALGVLQVAPSPGPPTLCSPASEGLRSLCGVLLASPASAQDEWLEVEVATVGVDLATGTPLALVHQGWNEVLPIWIGEVEAQAILRELQGVAVPRPMTHDLLVALLGHLEAELVEVRIHDLREGTYYGSLHVRRPGRDGLTEVDTRPSDGLALAVRTGARIRVARRLLAGVPDVDFVSTEEDRPVARLRGVLVARPGPEDRERLDLPDRDGVVVLHADVAGAPEVGDLVVEVEGRAVTDVMDYINAVIHRPGPDDVRLTVIREGREVEVRLPPRRGPGRVGD
ncbi:MAG: bifunctional nuclease domain-containing protein [bacterium]